MGQLSNSLVLCVAGGVAKLKNYDYIIEDVGETSPVSIAMKIIFRDVAMTRNL